MAGQTEEKLDRSSEHFLPTNLPKPMDDKACNHLWAMDVPSLPLASTEGGDVDLSKLPGFTVVFCFPRMGKPKEPISEDWNSIPGARGCTPQACSISAAAPNLKSVGISNIFSLSTQDPEHQKATRQYLLLRHHLLSDENFAFCNALRLPVLEWRNMLFIKRVTLLLDHGKIVWVDYPIFPAIKSAETVMNFMKKQSINQPGHGRCGNEKALSVPPPSPPSSPAGHTFPESGTTSSDTTNSFLLLPKGSGDVTSPTSESSGSKSHDPDPNSGTTSSSNPGCSSPPPPESSAVKTHNPAPKSGTASSDTARSSSMPSKGFSLKTHDPVPESSTVSSDTHRSSPSPLRNSRAFVNPVSNISGLKLQGPVTIYHPCPDWTAQNIQKAAVTTAEAKDNATPKVTGEVTVNAAPKVTGEVTVNAAPKVTGETIGNAAPNSTGEVSGIAISNVTGEITGDVSQSRDGSGNKYSFNISGRFTTN